MKQCKETGHYNMSNEITITLKADDAEPILRKAAEDCALYGGWLDYIDRRTYNSPANSGDKLEEARKRWKVAYKSACRIVAAFGVERHETSEQEALTVTYPWRGGTRKPVNIGGVRFHRVEGQTQDFSDPHPSYRSEVHREACREAAKRTVRDWRVMLAAELVAG